MARLGEIPGKQDIEQRASIDAQARELCYQLITQTGSEARLFSASTAELSHILRATKSGSDLMWISDTIDFTTYSHLGQFRRDGITPHANHSLRTAIRLEDRGANVGMQVKALLHDTREDWDEDIPGGRLRRLGRKGTVEEFEQEFRNYYTKKTYDRECIDDMLRSTKIMDKKGKDPKAYFEDIIGAGLISVKGHDSIDSARGDISRLARAVLAEDYDAVEHGKQQVRRSSRKTLAMTQLVPRENDPFRVKNDMEITVRAAELLIETPTSELMKLRRKPEKIFPNSRAQA